MMTHKVALMCNGSEANLMDKIERMEKQGRVIQGAVQQCDRCNRFSVISFSSQKFVMDAYSTRPSLPAEYGDILSYYNWINSSFEQSRTF